MGQLLNLGMEQRIEFDEHDNNGLVIRNRYLPEELLTEILCYVDHRTLLSCQLVCKRWNTLLQNYVWKKKAEMIIKRPVPSEKHLHWSVYYVVCKKRPFEKNLIKNHSGKKGIKKNWLILSDGGDRWKVEHPPDGVPALPSNEPIFEGEQYCFATSYESCTKVQVIDLVAEGLTPELLDLLQPPITVSEWYSGRCDCPSFYECAVKLLNDKKQELDTFQFRDCIKDERQNQWLYVSHVFENYGQGLRTISFYHAGKDMPFWAGHFGSKMAAACVRVGIPEMKRSNVVASAPYDLE